MKFCGQVVMREGVLKDTCKLLRNKAALPGYVIQEQLLKNTK
jgi:hypothetical protein